MEVVQFFGWRKYLVSLIAATILLAVQASDCQAQLFRRHRAKPVALAPSYVFDSSVNIESPPYAGNAIHSRPVSARLPKWPFGSDYDPRIHRDADAGSRYPKFIGGFHSSHFTNVGLPSGDIGFRGNGLYWTPW